jgi:hypothetical protein
MRFVVTRLSLTINLWILLGFSVAFADGFSVGRQVNGTISFLVQKKPIPANKLVSSDGEEYLDLTDGSMKVYTLDDSFKGTEGSISFKLAMLDDEPAGVSRQNVLLMNTTDFRYNLIYDHTEHSVQVTVQSPYSLKTKNSIIRLPAPWKKGAVYQVVMNWKDLGEKQLEVSLLMSGDSASMVVASDGFPPFELLYVGCNPWGKKWVYQGIGVSSIVLGDQAKADSVNNRVFIPGDAGGDEKESVARIHAPLGGSSAVHVERDIRYAFDGNLNSSWMNPSGNDKEVFITIDFGTTSSVSGWKMAAIFPQSYSQPDWIGRDKDHKLYREIGSSTYAAEYSNDGKIWKRLYQPPQGTRIYADTYHEVSLPAAVNARFLRFGYNKAKTRSFGLVADIVVFGKDGKEVPSCRRRRSIYRMTGVLQDAANKLSYVRKSGEFLAETYNLSSVSSEKIKPEQTEQLIQTLNEIQVITDDRLAAYEEKVANTVKSVEQFYDEANRNLRVASYSALLDTAERRVGVMGVASQFKTVLDEMKGIASRRSVEEIGRFDELAATITTEFRNYSVKNKTFVRREGRFFVRPDGSKLIPWGFNYSLTKNPVQVIKQWPCNFFPTEHLPVDEVDFQNLRLMGFNTIRLCVLTRILQLDYETGTVNGDYIEILQKVLNYCNKYDIYVIVDYHVGWDGSIDRFVGSANADGPLLSKLFSQMTKLCHNDPAVLGYEIVANEPNLDKNTPWSLDNPERNDISDTIKIRTDWNDWLKNKYQTREAIQQAWSRTGKFPEQNALANNENWTSNSILAPHELLRKYPEMEYGDMTRLRDFYEFCVDGYNEVATSLMKQLRRDDPEHLVLYSVTHDLQFSKNIKGVNQNFPSHCRWWFDTRPEGVDCVHDHFELINMPHKFRPTGLPWYGGEMWVFENNAKSFSEILSCGGGLLGWQYGPGEKFAMALGFDRWIRPHWKIWSELSWFFNHADGFKDAKLAIVVSLFSPEPGFTGISGMLGQMDVDYDLITSLTVLRDPEVLNRYDAVILNLTRMDVDAVRNVLKTCTKPVLMAGRMDVDALADWGVGVRPALDGVFFNAKKSAGEAEEAVSSGTISLARKWFFTTDPDDAGMKQEFFKKTDFTGWGMLSVPGAWEDEAISQGLYAMYDGVAWYATRIDIPENLQQMDLTFYAGTVNDQDEIFFNGVSIGKTDASVPNYWKAERKYRIPQKLIKATGNTLVVRVLDEKGNGGITLGPVEISPWKYRDEEVVLTQALGSLSAGSLGQVEATPV